MAVEPLHTHVMAWYDVHARNLPWRTHGVTPWAVLVSEYMLQQTPVARVLPVFERWLEEWPSPAALASASSGDAIRAWGRLGYPRRALRLHAAATAIVVEHAGQVPASFEALRALPGVGDYTAAAVAAFAFQQRHAVLDANVRRVLSRLCAGVEFPPSSPTAAERATATALLPSDGADAALWSVAVMELGALVCTSTGPRCGECPVARHCAWRRSGYPAYDGPARPSQRYEGTDRQCRGRLLGVLREAEGPVHHSLLDATWAADEQRERCLASLLEDGLAVRVSERPPSYALP